jgi:hypothetical protein
MFDALEGAFQRREGSLVNIRTHRAFFDLWRDDPRFVSLLRRMDLA